MYSAYLNKKQNQKKGHLFKRAAIYGFAIFERVQKRYKEGKKAKTSLEIAVPNKFVDASEFYFKKGKEGKVQFLKRSKKVILELLQEDNERQEALRAFMSKNKINLKKEAGMDKMLAFFQEL